MSIFYLAMNSFLKRLQKHDYDKFIITYYFLMWISLRFHDKAIILSNINLAYKEGNVILLR